MRNPLLFLIFFVLKALSQDTSQWLRIDCGSATSYPDASGTLWQTDDDFIKTGENQMVSANNLLLADQFNNLRAFTIQNKNCYSLPATTSLRYFVRAVFYYGNYDGLSNPPTFDLEFDGNKWATVVIATTTIVYYEMIYVAQGDIISICLARTNDKQFPFISILESWPVPDQMYSNMTYDRAWFNGYRYNYGAGPNDWILGYEGGDVHNRVWQPMIPLGSNVVTATFASLVETTVNDPPVAAIIEAVQAPSPTDKLELSFTFSETNRLDHVELYFTEPLYTTATRAFNINVNSEFAYAFTPVYQQCDGVWINAISVGTLNIELVPINSSTLPPVISAIELYTASDPLVVNGLAVLINAFQQLEGWSGEPCLPSDMVWQWLNCRGDNPPRVTSISLSGYGLDGPLPDFSQMTALETMSGFWFGSKSGSVGFNSDPVQVPTRLDPTLMIPDFLGKLPNLRLLDLRDNKFEGGVPESITSNKQLKYLIGSSNDNQSESKRLALIIGLAVGLPIFLVFLLALAYFLVRKQKTSSQGQVTVLGVGGNQGVTATEQPGEGVVSTTLNTEALIRPSLAIEYYNTSVPNGDSFGSDPDIQGMHHLTLANEDPGPGAMPVVEETSMDANAESIHHDPTVMQLIDEEELNDLLRRHGQN
ncbi:hypothetical protein V6N12_039649 [Hibiscus sabdariffa]|uniref:Malectin-like domain-containing protein n=1 Tax=Hibiscus sabdariffa TaxID=183260 RepID=A0ABR2E2M1_9ROSI